MGFLTLTRIDVQVGVYRILERVIIKMKVLDPKCPKSILTGELWFLCQKLLSR